MCPIVIVSAQPPIEKLTSGPLKAHVRDDLRIGGALFPYSADTIWNVGQPKVIAEREFNAITAASYMAYDTWMDYQFDRGEQPNPKRLVSFVDWAEQHDLKVHGHVLLWPGSNRDLAWYQRLSLGKHEKYVKQYIRRMAGAVQGRIWVWDVVNEVIADDDHADVDRWGLRTDFVEYQSIGPDYVAQAFRWADSADPDAELIINDFGTEAINQKSDRLFRYTVELKRRGVPIDGVGFQMHIWDLDREPDYVSIHRNFDRFIDAGLDVYITELDVRATNTRNRFELTPDDQLRRQRAVYQQIARIASAHVGVKSLLFWDYVDGRSWINPIDSGPEQGTYTFPTIHFGGAGRSGVQRKPAYHGVINGLIDGATAVALKPGQYTVRCDWEPESSNWKADGDQVELQSRDHPGHAWRLIPAEYGYYRIQTGQQPPRLLERTEQSVRLVDSQSDDPRQLWRIEHAPDQAFCIVSAWQPFGGVITHDATEAGTAGSTLSLQERNDQWSSQRWRFLADPHDPADDR